MPIAKVLGYGWIGGDTLANASHSTARTRVAMYASPSAAVKAGSGRSGDEASHQAAIPRHELEELRDKRPAGYRGGGPTLRTAHQGGEKALGKGKPEHLADAGEHSYLDQDQHPHVGERDGDGPGRRSCRRGRGDDQPRPHASRPRAETNKAEGFLPRPQVGATGFEPATPSTPYWCATKLRHAPFFGYGSAVANAGWGLRRGSQRAEYSKSRERWEDPFRCSGPPVGVNFQAFRRSGR